MEKKALFNFFILSFLTLHIPGFSGTLDILGFLETLDILGFHTFLPPGMAVAIFNHIKARHSISGFSLPCNVCKKTFNSATDLLNHVARCEFSKEEF